MMGIKSSRTALLSRPDGSGEPSYVRVPRAGAICALLPLAMLTGCQRVADSVAMVVSDLQNPYLGYLGPINASV